LRIVTESMKESWCVLSQPSGRSASAEGTPRMNVLCPRASKTVSRAEVPWMETKLGRMTGPLLVVERDARTRIDALAELRPMEAGQAVDHDPADREGGELEIELDRVLVEPPRHLHARQELPGVGHCGAKRPERERGVLEHTGDRVLVGGVTGVLVHVERTQAVRWWRRRGHWVARVCFRVVAEQRIDVDVEDELATRRRDLVAGMSLASHGGGQQREEAK